MQENKTVNSTDFTDIFRVPARGRVVSLDIGTKNIGVAVSDEIQFTVRALAPLTRSNWKKLLSQVKDLLKEFDAVGLVLGLPYGFYGDETEMSADVRRLARNFALSLEIPIILQDERVTSIAARENLHNRGHNLKEIRSLVDSESAAIILNDFFDLRREKIHHRDTANTQNFSES